jgi:predicted Co/Zn/Cd cation transporter (cation efflux family)
VRRALTILLTTLATVVLIAAFLFIPLSLVTAQYGNVAGELAIVSVTLWYITRVMRQDRRERRAAEAALPPERRPVRRAPRRPITFQLRETLVAVAIWFVLVAAFNALVLGLGPGPNVGISIFAAFMLATITVTGRHMMFRLTAEDDPAEEA